MLSVERSPMAGLSHLLAAAALMALSTQAFADQWSIKNLGTVPGSTFSQGTAINDSGQVAGNVDLGYVFNPENGSLVDGGRAFLSEPDGGALALLDVGPPNQFFDFTAAAVNNSGQVVGSARQGSSTDVAFTTGPEGESPDFLTFHTGVDINNAGDALYQRTFGAVLVMQADGSVTQVVDSGTTGIARGINDAGQVVLITKGDPSSSVPNGMVWSQADGFHPVLADGSQNDPYDINNAGQVLGKKLGPDGGIFIADANGTPHFLNLPAGNLIAPERLIGGPPSLLPKFNDLGQVIGQFKTAAGNSFAFVTAIDGGALTNLEALPAIMQAGFSNLQVAAINNLGQITGTGIVNGQPRAFLLSPVPEPGTYALMLAGLGLLGGAARRRKAKVRAAS